MSENKSFYARLPIDDSLVNTQDFINNLPDTNKIHKEQVSAIADFGRYGIILLNDINLVDEGDLGMITSLNSAGLTNYYRTRLAALTDNKINNDARVALEINAGLSMIYNAVVSVRGEDSHPIDDITYMKTMIDQNILANLSMAFKSCEKFSPENNDNLKKIRQTLTDVMDDGPSAHALLMNLTVQIQASRENIKGDSDGKKTRKAKVKILDISEVLNAEKRIVGEIDVEIARKAKEMTDDIVGKSDIVFTWQQMYNVIEKTINEDRGDKNE